MIVESFQSETYVQNRMDVQHTPIWDTVTFAVATAMTQTNTAFFTNVGPASGKTLAGTNMTQQNKLAAPQAFSILGFRLRYQEDILRLDLLSIVAGFAYNFVLGEKPYNQAPIWFYCAGGGIHGFSTITDQATYNNGVPGRNAMHKLAIPIVIENQMNFSANLVGNNYTTAAAAAGGTGVVLQSLLDGLYARGVQ